MASTGAGLQVRGGRSSVSALLAGSRATLELRVSASDDSSLRHMAGGDRASRDVSGHCI